jgi:hypothetical protein
LASEAGFDHHLVKPVVYDELKRILAKVARTQRSPMGSSTSASGK